MLSLVEKEQPHEIALFYFYQRFPFLAISVPHNAIFPCMLLTLSLFYVTGIDPR